MNIWQLKVFLAVARAKSLSAAARLLYLSQPAVSAQILSLERHFNLRLLQRHRHGVSLTPAGQVVYEHAVRVLALLEEMEKAVIAAERVHRVSLAITRTVETVPLARAIHGFLAANPDLDVELEILAAREVLAGVRSGRYDLGLLADGEGHFGGQRGTAPPGRSSGSSALREVPLAGRPGGERLRLVCREDAPTPELAAQLAAHLAGVSAAAAAARRAIGAAASEGTGRR